MNSLHFLSRPVQSIHGELCIPGDKSISHRALIFGAIAKGTTKIHGFLEGGDCLATLQAFKAMGVNIERSAAGQVIIHGVGKYGLQAPHAPLDCGNSGTSMRLLAGLLAAQAFDSELTGDASLQQRPMKRIQTPLTQMGACVETKEGLPPIKIRGGQQLHGISYQLPEASAQVKSCLLLAALYAQGETTIIEPQTTRDHSENMLMTFSYPIMRNNNQITLTSSNECLATELRVPGDISSAAFFIVAASLIPGSELELKNVGINPTRTGILHILLAMGANISFKQERHYGEELVADLVIKYAALEGLTIPTEIVPLAIDEFPIICIAAACAKGQTILRGANELRLKESDRIAAMVTGLLKLGIKVEAFEDGLAIQGGILQGGEVDSFHDHRIAMAFTVAGAVAKAPVKIKNCNQVATSFPNFVGQANAIHLDVEAI